MVLETGKSPGQLKDEVRSVHEVITCNSRPSNLASLSPSPRRSVSSTSGMLSGWNHDCGCGGLGAGSAPRYNHQRRDSRCAARGGAEQTLTGTLQQPFICPNAKTRGCRAERCEFLRPLFVHESHKQAQHAFAGAVMLPRPGLAKAGCFVEMCSSTAYFCSKGVRSRLSARLSLSTAHP